VHVLGLAGWSGSGKTTLIARLLPGLVARGLRVSTIKHAHHGFDVDQPGKDSHVHRMAGASEVMVSSAARFALVHEHRGAPEPTLEELVARMSRVDLLLVEGFKRHPHAKLEVHRPALGKPLLAASDPHVRAVAADAPLTGLAVPVLPLDDVGRIADFVVGYCQDAPPWPS
jgi:molybdopterin-guanine dinucleotide biosynthesis protein B